MYLGSILRFRAGLFALPVSLIACIGVLVPAAEAASCTTQSAMNPVERSTLSGAARAMLTQVQNGDLQGLKAATLPAVAADFGGIAQSVQALQPHVRAATITVDAVYNLDASTDQAGQANTQF